MLILYDTTYAKTTIHVSKWVPGESCEVDISAGEGLELTLSVFTAKIHSIAKYHFPC